MMIRSRLMLLLLLLLKLLLLRLTPAAGDHERRFTGKVLRVNVSFAESWQQTQNTFHGETPNVAVVISAAAVVAPVTATTVVADVAAVAVTTIIAIATTTIITTAVSATITASFGIEFCGIVA